MIFKFFNIKLKKNKNFNIEIQQIFGIGLNISYKLNKLLGINKKKKINLVNLSIEKIILIKNYLSRISLYDLNLKQSILNEKEKFLELKCYKRNRFLLNLPVRGQRTRTNAKTVRKTKLL